MVRVIVYIHERRRNIQIVVTEYTAKLHNM